MKELINDTLEIVEPMAKANGNRLIQSVGALSISLNLDRQKMMQVFLNLLSNACKFTKNGEIEFFIENNETHLNFSVRDTGVGIPKDKQKYKESMLKMYALIFEHCHTIIQHHIKEEVGYKTSIHNNVIELLRKIKKV